MKVSGIRATLGVRSGNACLEKFSYDSAAPTRSRLRLHLTIDQSFKDRLAQIKKTTAAGQWSPISPTPACSAVMSTSGHSHGWNPSDSVYTGSLITDVAAILEDGVQYATDGNSSYAQQIIETSQCSVGSVIDSVTSAMTSTTPADLSDLSSVDLLQFPADWNVQLADVDVDADFSPLTDFHPPVTDTASLVLPTATDYVANDLSGFVGNQLPATSELFPVYDDIGAFLVGDNAPVFNWVDDIFWNTSNIGHAISVQ